MRENEKINPFTEGGNDSPVVIAPVVYRPILDFFSFFNLIDNHSHNHINDSGKIEESEY
jgi:hypothetical protein